VYLSLNISNS